MAQLKIDNNLSRGEWRYNEEEKLKIIEKLKKNGI